jgi:hypothetical protein
MGRANPNKLIQRYHTAEEMQTALANLSAGTATRSLPAQDDDDDVVMRDCINELLEARQALAEMRGFVSTWHARLVGRSRF